VILGSAVPARPARPLHPVLGELSSFAAALSGGRGDEERDEAAVHGIEQRLEELEAPLVRFIHLLHPWVAFGIMPLFALANSGVHLAGLEPSQLTGRVAVGTAVALLAGKQVGIFAFTIAADAAGVGDIPGGASRAKLLGVSIVAGIGFTVALFIAGLAYPGSPRLLDEAKLGILAGSLASGVAGALVLRSTPRVRPAASEKLGAQR
jgi:NhaA family Na+:H+ antiporter